MPVRECERKRVFVRGSRNVIPRYGTYIDDILEDTNADVVYFVGDTHDSETNVLHFLKSELILPDTCVDLTDARIDEEKRVLVIFVGDVLYKTPNSFMSVFRFILNNPRHVRLCLGNNEFKFLTDVETYSGLFTDSPNDTFLDIVRNMNDPSLYIHVTNNRSSYAYIILEKIYSRTYHCLCEQYETARVSYEQDRTDMDKLKTVIVLYIMTKSILFAYWAKMKIFVVHAGFKLDQKLCDQKLSTLCNVRTADGNFKSNIKNTDDLRMAIDKSWMTYSAADLSLEGYLPKDSLVIFGHYSELCALNQHNPLLIRKNMNHFLCLDTGCYKSNVLSCAKVGANTNRFASKTFNIGTNLYKTTTIKTVVYC